MLQVRAERRGAQWDLRLAPSQSETPKSDWMERSPAAVPESLWLLRPLRAGTQSTYRERGFVGDSKYKQEEIHKCSAPSLPNLKVHFGESSCFHVGDTHAGGWEGVGGMGVGEG